MKSLPLVVVFLSLVFNALAVEQRLALVIGNSAYEHLPPLTNPSNDANDMADRLGKVGFDVMVYQDLDKTGLKNAILKFGERLESYETGMFYYAGHAIEVGGQNYFIPIDARVETLEEVRTQNVPVNALIRAMRFSNCKTKIIIMDACRSNPFKGSASELSGGLALMDAPEGSIVCFSTSPGKTALDGSGRNGVYTEAILKYIMTPDLDIVELFHHVRSDVLERTSNQQIPWETTSLTQPFVFNIKPEVSLQVNVIEGTSVHFEGKGTLHARSNVNNVSYQWYEGERHIKDSPSLEIRKSGTYHIKAISPQGQVAESNSITVDVSSFVKPKVIVKEGESVNFKGYGYIHALTNITGEFTWYRDGDKVKDGYTLLVSNTGMYNAAFEAVDGQKTKSNFIKVKVNKPKINVAADDNLLFEIENEKLNAVLSDFYQCDSIHRLTSEEKLHDLASSGKPNYFVVADGLTPTEIISMNKLKLVMPLFSQFFAFYSHQASGDLSVVYVKKSEEVYTKIIQKYLKDNIKFVAISDASFDNSLGNKAVQSVFFMTGQDRVKMDSIRDQHELLGRTDQYNSLAVAKTTQDVLVINTYLGANELPKYEKNYFETVSQFFALRNNNENYDFSGSCGNIMRWTRLKVHKALFEYLNQNPNSCRSN